MLKLLIDAEKKKTKDSVTTIDKLSKEKKAVEVEKKTADDHYSKLKKEMEKMMEQDRLQRGLLENEIKDMRSTIHEQREKINKLDGEILEMQRKAEEQVSESEIEKLRQDNNNLLDELRRNMEELIKMEELELLVPQLKEKDKEIDALLEEVAELKERLGEKDRELEGEDQHIHSLKDSLKKTEHGHNKLQQQVEHLQRERKELIDKLKKRDETIEEKNKEIKSALDALESVKISGKKLKLQVEKSAKERDEVTKRLDKVLGDFTAMKKAKEEIQAVLDKLQEEFRGYKDTLSKKDEWILKQGNEMKLIAEQHAALKKKHLEYKLEIDLEKNTEILVLKEMVKSTKSMVRAKDVDLTRLKRKAFASESSMLMHNASDDDRAALTTAKSSLSKTKPGIIARSPAGALKAPNNLRSMARLGPPRIPEHDSMDEESERPVYKVVKSIDDKRQVTVRKSPSDIKKYLDDEDKRRSDAGHGVRLNKLVKA